MMKHDGEGSVCSDMRKYAVLFSSFATKFFNFGLRKSFGILLLTLSSQFDVDIWLMGMIVSVMVSVGDLSGPVYGGLANRYGCRVVVMIGGVLLCVGMILASLSTTVVQLTASLCVFCGLGFGFANDLPFAVLGQYFQQNFIIANSIGMSGYSVGIMILAPLTQVFIELYGWRGTLLLLGGIVFNLIVCGALLKPPMKVSPEQQSLDATEYQPLPGENEDEISAESDVNNKCCCHCLGSSLDGSLFADPLFAVIVAVTATMRFTQMAWIVYLVPSVVSKGVPSDLASFVATTAGIGDLIGRLLPCVAQWRWRGVSGTTMWSVGMAVTSVSLLLAAVVNSYTGMMILGIFQGLGIGLMCSLIPVVLFEEFGEGKLVNSMSWLRSISGLGLAFGGTLPGVVFYFTNSYNWSYLILGITQALGLALLYIGQNCFASKHPQPEMAPK